MLKKHPHIAFLLLIGVAFAIGYIYFFQISPAFVEKPILEKPDIVRSIYSAQNITAESIKAEHLIYLLNEIGAYRLHNDMLTGNIPVIDVEISDEGKQYFFSVENNKIKEIDKLNPDIKLVLSQETAISLYNGEISLNDAAKDKIGMEIYSDEKTLALKGYKAIYDSLSDQESKITGKVIHKMYPLGVMNLMNLSLLIVFSIIVGLVIEKEL